jgi:hypothetical protein
MGIISAVFPGDAITGVPILFYHKKCWVFFTTIGGKQQGFTG